MTVACRDEDGQPAPTNLHKQQEDRPLEPEAEADIYMCMDIPYPCIIWIFYIKIVPSTLFSKEMYVNVDD